MKTYVIIISKTFPAYHKNKGKPTFFEEQILEKLKIHTIRMNYQLWKDRFEKIDKGEACISIRKWTGKPYKSRQVEILKLDRSHGIGIEKLTNIPGHRSEVHGELIDKRILSKNDGLSIGAYLNWFKDVPINKDLAIIHFTKFRYA